MAATEQTRWTAVLFDFDGTLGDASISSSIRCGPRLPNFRVTPSMKLR